MFPDKTIHKFRVSNLSPLIDVSELHKISHLTDFEAFKSWNIWSGWYKKQLTMHIIRSNKVRSGTNIPDMTFLLITVVFWHPVVYHTCEIMIMLQTKSELSTQNNNWSLSTGFQAFRLNLKLFQWITLTCSTLVSTLWAFFATFFRLSGLNRLTSHGWLNPSSTT